MDGSPSSRSDLPARDGDGPCPPSSPGEVTVTGGGELPGSGGAPAFSHHAPRAPALPVLIAVPHAGRHYPEVVLDRMRSARLSQLRLEDRHVDLLGIEAARQTGCGLLVAHAPRALIDLNRSEDDIDWDMIDGGPPRGRARNAPAAHANNRRARSGLGLVPRRLPGFGDIWRGRMALAELDARIVGIHRPYHDRLAAELSRLRRDWGAALLLDLHSMPPLPPKDGESRGADIVLGDRFGATCHHGLMARALRYLDRQGCRAVQNRPYSGGYVLDRHGRPMDNVHALQIEVCRTTYLDRDLAEPIPAFSAMAGLLAGLVRDLGAEVALLGGAETLRAAAE